MVHINIHEAKTTLSRIIKAVEERGEHVRLCRNGKPVAEIVPLSKVTHPLKQDKRLKVRINTDPVKPLDPEDWPEA